MKLYAKSVLIASLGVLFVLSCEKKQNSGTEQFKVIKYAPVDVAKTNPMHIYAHYMPWFEDKNSTSDGNWGIHWTMATRNPDVIDEEGNRNIASHFYPIIGPYASGDPDLIEYHLLLMKYSGIEGILIDWYGASDLNDYESIRANSEKIISKIDQAGLKYAVVYEDRTVSAALDQNPQTDRISAAQDDMNYIEDHYFTDQNYICIDGKPLFMVFGPEEFHSPDNWSDIFSAFSDDPIFLILNGKSFETAPNSQGEYIWVDNGSLDSKYGTKTNFEYFMGGAYPGFQDYYLEGGWGNGFNWQIDFDNGETFSNNLIKAKDNQVNLLQLITWNDFGEGTMIEPTKEYGYTFLEKVQAFSGVSYSKTELESIYKLYILRKELASENEIQNYLDQSFYYFVSLQNQKAIVLIDSIEQNQKL